MGGWWWWAARCAWLPDMFTEPHRTDVHRANFALHCASHRVWSLPHCTAYVRILESTAASSTSLSYLKLSMGEVLRMGLS